MIYLIAVLVGLTFGLIAVEASWPKWVAPTLAFVTVLAINLAVIA